jgi:putative DNA primase/helicase
MSGPADRVIAALEAHGCNPRQNGAGWGSRCPGHDDRVASLSIGEGEDGRALIICHAGCELAAVLQALGLEMRDLFDGPVSTARETRYRVCNAAGELVAVHVRRDGLDGKRFHWERNGTPGLDGLRVAALPLYGSAAVAGSTGPVILVEGEKAADALRQRGMNAVATVCGAASCPTVEVLSVLAGRDVVLWPDADAPGHDHMQRIAQRLTGIAASVRMFPWPHAPKHGDAFDFFAQGGTANDVRALLEHAAPVEHEKPETERAAKKYRLTRMSEVEPRKLSWLWRHRIPLGMVTLIAGEGGVGKSTALLDLAARVTTGQSMPDGSEGLGKPAGVIVLSSEDAIDSVIVPRLELAAADRSLVATIAIPAGEGEDRPLLITPEDLKHLEAAVVEMAAQLVVFDPLVAYVEDKANLHHNQDARRVMALLHVLAERLAIAVVGVHHFNRAQHVDAAHKLTGSLALSQAARSVLVAGPDPEDSTGERRILALAKHNLAPRSTSSMAFRLELPAGSEHPRVEWLGESSVRASDLVAVPTDPEERSALDEAADFLRTVLANGPILATEGENEAHQRGIATRTLERARRRVGVVAEREEVPDKGSVGVWWWRLPNQVAVWRSGALAPRDRPPEGHNATPPDRQGEQNATPSTSPASLADLAAHGWEQEPR